MNKSVAIYSVKQPECTAYSMDGLSYVNICENEQEVTIEDEQEVTIEDEQKTIQYQYDLYSLICKEGKIDLTAVMANPKSYLDFEPEADPTVQTQVTKNTGDIAYMSMMTGVDL